MHGKSWCKYENGDIYEGDFENGVKTGMGKYIFSNGAIFEGKLKNNKFEGNGTLQTNDFKFMGDFSEDQFHGRGIMQSKQFIYDGEFNKGKFQGEGFLVLENQDTIKGKFENNQIIEGEYIFCNTQCKIKAQFQNNYPLGEITMILQNGDEISLHYNNDQGLQDQEIQYKSSNLSVFKGVINSVSMKFEGEIVCEFPEGAVLLMQVKDGIKEGNSQLKLKSGEAFKKKFQNGREI